MQVAAYEFILEKQLAGCTGSGRMVYLRSGNRVEDSAVAMTMCSALANRFLHVELREDAELWVQWGLRHKVHPAVLGFIRYRPDLLFHQENENLERGWPTPRSWERVSSMLLSFDKTDSVLCNKVISGLVGCQVGVEFCAFLTISEEFDNVYE